MPKLADPIVPSGPRVILTTMGEKSDRRPPGDWEGFASRWLACLLVVLVRCVRRPALAYDLATETLSAARLWWQSVPDDDDAAGVWLLEHAARVLQTSVERKRVPAIERRRGHQPAPYGLSAAEQQEIARLAEAQLELSPSVQDAVDALVRTAPPPHLLAELRLSGLVDAEPLPNSDRHHHGA